MEELTDWQIWINEPSSIKASRVGLTALWDGKTVLLLNGRTVLYQNTLVDAKAAKEMFKKKILECNIKLKK